MQINKFLVVTLSLLAAGLVFFAIAGYCYWTILDMQKTFAYYGLSEKDYLLSSNVAHTIANLKFGIVKFSILGVFAWIISFIFFAKRNHNV